MNNKKMFLVLVLLAITIFACTKNDENDLPDVEPTGKPLVRVAVAEMGPIQAVVNYSGKIKSEKSINIAPELSMRLISVYVDEGDKVKSGQLLAKLDTTKLAQARLQYKDAKKNYARMKALKRSEYVEEQRFEQVKTAYEVAKYNFEYLQKNTIIRAPFSGFITAKTKKEGEFYSSMLPGASGSPSLFRLVNPDDLKVKIYLPDKDINKIILGQKAIIKVESAPEQTFQGEVTFISEEADYYSGMFPCYIKILDHDKLIKPNLFARVSIITASADKATIIPKAALIDSQFVFTVKDSKVYKKNVTTGISNDNNLQLLGSTIKPGEKVVIKGNVGLRNNLKVEIENK